MIYKVSVYVCRDGDKLLICSSTQAKVATASVEESRSVPAAVSGSADSFVRVDYGETLRLVFDIDPNISPGHDPVLMKWRHARPTEGRTTAVGGHRGESSGGWTAPGRLRRRGGPHRSKSTAISRAPRSHARHLLARRRFDLFAFFRDRSTHRPSAVESSEFTNMTI
ncbi:hypothetical protein EVAR_12914_1 [Eumeta japonica]|uniref:Uncharacterized protein n=1 Tax=Eumeta variegata TaxID=151549 RepID=A0A4C1TVR3_EUMVA|nr:hypothetical protein EVAR_12914_1 [Eumeta japonica]